MRSDNLNISEMAVVFSGAGEAVASRVCRRYWRGLHILAGRRRYATPEWIGSRKKVAHCRVASCSSSRITFGAVEYQSRPNGISGHADPDNSPTKSTAPAAETTYNLPKASIMVLRVSSGRLQKWHRVPADDPGRFAAHLQIKCVDLCWMNDQFGPPRSQPYTP